MRSNKKLIAIAGMNGIGVVFTIFVMGRSDFFCDLMRCCLKNLTNERA